MSEDHNIVRHNLVTRSISHSLERLSSQEVNASQNLRKPLGWEYALHRQFTVGRLFEQPSSPEREIDITEDLVELCLVDLFKNREVVYPSDIVAALDLDYDTVESIFAKFVKEGKLKE